MEFTTQYVLSQIFTIMMYLLLVITYQLKNRKAIIIVSFGSLIANGIAYILLNAYTGLAMCFAAGIRDVILLIDENKNGKREIINKKDYVYLAIFYILIIAATIFTYQGIYSLLSVVATITFTYSIWQKSTKTYKMLGIPVGILWVAYNTYVKSIFGVILESMLLVASIIGYIREIKGKKQN